MRICKKESILLIGSYVLIYMIMAYLTSLTPMSQDDFVYWPYWWHYPYRQYDLGEVLQFMIRHWEQANGRVLAHFILMTLILGTDWLYIFLTPLVFCGAIWLGEYLIWGTLWKEKIRFWHPLLIFSLIWLFTPLFGHNYLWRTGTANYLYTTFIAFLFLARYRNMLDKPRQKLRLWAAPLWIILSVAAGATNENLGIVVFLTSVVATFAIYRKSKKPSAVCLSGCLFSLAGWLTLILSPGSRTRIHTDAPDFLNNGVLGHLTDYFHWWLNCQLDFTILTLVFIAGLIANRKRFFTEYNLIAIYLFCAGQLCILAFAFSPIFPKHALSSASFLLCLSVSYYLFAGYGKFLKTALVAWILLWAANSVISDGILHFREQDKTTQLQLRQFASGGNPVITDYRNTYSKYFIFEMFPIDKPDFLREYVRKYFHVDGYTLEKPAG